MIPTFDDWVRIGLAAAVAFIVAYVTTPPVKRFAEHVGAIDVPKDGRRVHDHPIPRMGGLAIFMGFVLSVLLFVNMSMPVLGLLLGAVIIAVLGAVDDIVSLKPLVKLAGQILAAVVAIRCGLVFDTISNPNLFSQTTFIQVGWLSVPLTLLWIVGCTNAVNLIDGLDGLAVGVSAISSLTMLVVSLYVADPLVSILLAALVGACLGFMPFNLNPAQIFMGDVGSQTLGFILSGVSIMGLFKFHAIITFIVPVLALAVPLTDTTFAFVRRIAHGQSPFHADRGHLHHRLLAAGMSQKQAVAVIYGVSALFGLLAVLLTGDGPHIRVICLVLALAVSFTVWLFVFRHNPKLHVPRPVEDEEAEQLAREREAAEAGAREKNRE
ncbi:MAG: undecaprenyl/decaprenyl-phosphate alpha-N-acetylglucosaminyl 1-phosphate transferase [Oscillospiraceae bacterium]|nr:undecaprenyl/decaprenyl-phosphate alpha-N-acetylglucosaminyl 1-phosphate transferase [Oscillospiraceae bacterium]